jgi:hypothetical protein
VPISYSNYIDITSGVGANETVKERDLITRIFTSNPLAPTKSVIEFTTLGEVASYFGTASEEYQRASFYFSYVSKLIGTPDNISFGKWTSTAVAPTAFSNPLAVGSLAAFTAITAGSFTFSLGGVSLTTTAIDFAIANSLGGVATVLETAIRAAAATASAGPAFTGASVTYTAAANGLGGYFTLIGGTTGSTAGTITVDQASGDTIANLLGMQSINTIYSAGGDVETITQTLTNSATTSTNFFSFLFLNSLALSQANMLLAAEWCASNNVDYMYLVPVTASNAAALSAALGTYEGVALTLSPLLTPAQFPAMFPGMLAAATDYSQPNAVANFMYQPVNGLTPSVLDDADKATYDGLIVNYYGQTQVNGQTINFYQDGYLCGGATSPQDMGVYTNEAWLKGAVTSQLFDMLLDLNQVPVNANGLGIVQANIQSVVTQALVNGCISVGKSLSITQQQYITAATGNNKAWQQVQTIGYWLGLSFSTTTGNNSITIYQVDYTLIYSKNDSVREVVGTHVLI